VDLPEEKQESTPLLTTKKLGTLSVSNAS